VGSRSSSRKGNSTRRRADSRIGERAAGLYIGTLLRRLFRSGRKRSVGLEGSARGVEQLHLRSAHAKADQLFLFAGGVDAELYEARMASFAGDFAADSGISLRAKVVFIATSWRDLSQLPELGRMFHPSASAWQRSRGSGWRLGDLHKRAGCQIVQNNFDRPAWRVGITRCAHAASAGSLFRR
jgi:hypothetical protein